MKRNTLLRSLSLMFAALATAFVFSSCSTDNDEPDMPDNPGNSGSGESSDFAMNTIPYTDLPGTWLIESIKDTESGKSIAINQEITIGEFTPAKFEGEFPDLMNYDMWTYVYDDLISYEAGDDGIKETADASFTFFKDKNASLNSARVGRLIFVLLYKNGEYLGQYFTLTGLSISNGEVISQTGTYATKDNLGNPYSGPITMKKL